MGINEIISTDSATLLDKGKPPSLADILVLLAKSTSLSSTRKRDLRSAITRFARMTGSSPDQLPADVAQLTPHLSSIHSAQVGISVKTLQNVKSNLLAALHHTRNFHQSTRKYEKLSADWQHLYERLPGKRFHSGLSRFVHFSSNHGILPEKVNDDTVHIFIQDLTESSFITIKKSKDIHRRTTRLWNQASESVASWPSQTLIVPEFRAPRTTRALTDFPKSFQTEVAHYLDWLKDDDPFAKSKPPRRCRPGTIRLRKSQIQLAASALSQRGQSISTIHSLACLVDTEAVKNILRFYLDKKGESSAFISGMAICLVSIAGHWVGVPDKQLAELKTIKRQLGGQPSGLTDKNRHTLRQFEDDHNRQLLLTLPGQLVKKAKTQTSAKAAISVQLAVAIEILLMAPIRMVNLITLRFEQNLVRPGGQKGNYHLVLPGHETKNAEPLEFQLPEHLTHLIDRYRTNHLPSIKSEPNDYLFPNKDNSHKAQATLSQQIKETVYKHTGLHITAHQFRHLAALFYLDAMPGHYESVRQLLGHKNLKTTTSFYTGMNTREATRTFDDIIIKERARLSDKDMNKGGNKI